MTEPMSRVDGRCQLCGWPCDAEFCSEGHFHLWALARVAPAVMEEAAAQWRAAAEAMRPVFDALGQSLLAMRWSIVESGMVPDEPPADPMQRALHLRRYRNTGPQVHADPRRNRRRG